jgi:hypothetical protein
MFELAMTTSSPVKIPAIFPNQFNCIANFHGPMLLSLWHFVNAAHPRYACALLELLKHHKRIHKTKFRMLERSRQAADDVKTEFLPKSDSGFVGGDDDVVLHRAKAHSFGLGLRMFAHQRGDALAASLGADDITGIADVGTEAGLVWLEEIGAEDNAVSFGDVGCGRGIDPGFAGFGFGNVRGVRISFAGPKNGFKDLPDSRPVAGFKFSDRDQACDERLFAARK